MIAFVVFFVAALLVFAVLDGFARHMGNPEPTDWVTIVVVSLLVGLVGAGLWAGLVEATRVVTVVLS